IPPRGLVFDDARSQLVSSSGLRPSFTISPPKMNGFNTCTLRLRSFTNMRCNQSEGTVEVSDIFRTTAKDPSLYCMAAVIFSTLPKFGMGQRPPGLSHDHTSFSTRPLGHTPP